MKYRYIRRLKCPKNLLPSFKATRALQWLGYYALPHNKIYRLTNRDRSLLTLVHLSVRSDFGDELVADLGELLVLLRLLLHRPLQRGDLHLGLPTGRDILKCLGWRKATYNLSHEMHS